MLGLVALILLLLLTPNIANQPRYALSPELPPSAFLGQPYACQFQVSGLTPVFSFKGLPKGFVGDASGMMKGTPGSKGTFAITISFASSRIKSSHQTLLRVVSTSEFSVNNNANSSQYPVLSITANIDSYIFMAGTQVSMQFSTIMGRQPYQWTYLRLPTELTGTLDGSLSGFFQEQGYFSFGVAVGDKDGQSAYCFITLNIQPLTFFTQWAPQALRPITDVRVKDFYSLSATQQAWRNYYSAAQLLSLATSNATDAQNNLKQAQKKMMKMNKVLDMAKQYLKDSEMQLALATIKRTQAEKVFKRTNADLSAITRTLSERQSAFNLAQYSANQSYKRLQDLQSICSKLSKLLQKASSDLTQAQNNLTSASSQLQNAQIVFDDSQQSLSSSLSAKDVANQQFQTVTVSSERVFGDVQKARGQVYNKKQSVSQAMDSFLLANSTVTISLQYLSDANDNVSSLTRAANSAKNNVGQANMRLALALNQLYVATAAKQQADKAMVIVSSQLTNTPQNETISSLKPPSFSGCSQGAYPSSFGSGQIATQIPSGYLLQSGQKILIGNCTSGRGNISIGDSIYFQGYLRDGCIHAIKLSETVPN